MNAISVKTKGAVTDRSAVAVDLHVGCRVRMRRRFLGLSQQSLAAELGLTFQQVQKYERGANRISASKLYEIARVLGVPVSFFFEGLPDPAAPAETVSRSQSREQSIADFMRSSDGAELADAFSRLSRGRLRRHVVDFVRALAEDEALS